MKKKKDLIRIIAIFLVVLMVGGVIVSAAVSAMAEGTPVDCRELHIDYNEDEQALHIEQRLVYYNRSTQPLDRVLFYAAPNMFRRESALMYEPDVLQAVFADGYAPGGIRLSTVSVDGEAADYGFTDENELTLRVSAGIAPGDCATFEFEYDLLLVRCGAFIGSGDRDVRLCDFCFVPGMYDEGCGEFIINKMLPFTRWMFTDVADYSVDLTLPDGFDLACVGTATETDKGVWHIEANNIHDFALSFSRRRRATEKHGVRVLSASRNAATVAEAAAEALSFCAERFGEFPFAGLTVAESDIATGALNYPGLILLPSAMFEPKNREDMQLQIGFCVAQQYFGLSAYVEPSADAWLSDSVCNYLAYLMIEARDGRDAFLKAVNRDWVPALQLTMPGGLTVTSDGALFDSESYDVVIKCRGAAVMHELRQAMGLDDMLSGLRLFCEMGSNGQTLTEMDFVACMDNASGKSWESFLTDCVFNIGSYVEQYIDLYE